MLCIMFILFILYILRNMLFFIIMSPILYYYFLSNTVHTTTYAFCIFFLQFSIKNIYLFIYYY